MGLTSNRLRHNEVAIEQPNESQNDSGDTVQSWSEITRRKASVVPTGGREFQFGDQIRADISHKIKIRKDSITQGITPKMRLKLDGKILNIEVVNFVGHRGRWILLICKEVVI